MKKKSKKNMESSGLYFILLIANVVLLGSYTLAEPSCFDPHCQLNGKVLICNNFSKFEELDFNCQGDINLYTVFLQPLVQITLDDKLRFTGVKDLYELVLENVETIDLSSNPFKDVPRTLKQIEIRNSFIKLANEPKPGQGLFGNFNLNIFQFKNVRFLNGMPSALFDGTTIGQMAFSHSFLENAFANESQIFPLNITIRNLVLIHLKHLFNSNALNVNVFKRTTTIQLDDTPIGMIEPNFSQIFPVMKDLICNLSLNSDLKWLNSLNRDTWVLDLATQPLSQSDASKVFYLEVYDKGDYFTEDKFCDFVQFPYNNLVIPIIDAGAYQLTTKRNVTCTCTFYSLYKYHRQYANISVYSQYSTSIDCLKSPNFEKELLKCDIDYNQRLCTQKKCLEPYCKINGKNVICDNFDDFSQLNFTCWGAPLNIYSIHFKPTKTLTVDKKLNLKGIEDIYEIIFENVDTFDLLHNPFLAVADKIKQIEVKNTKLYFKNADSIHLGGGSLFSNLDLSILSFANVEFMDSMPSRTFENSDIEILDFSNTNFEKAFEPHQHDTNDFNINVEYVRFNRLKVPFSDSQLDHFVFKRTVDLTLDETPIASISNDFSVHFTHLKDLTVQMSLNKDQKWLSGLNKKVYFDLDKYELDEAFYNNLLFVNMYDSGNYFSDSKICDYKDFPHKQLVIPIVDSTQYTWEINRNISCTCTVYWLYKYHQRYLTVPGYDVYSNTIDCLDEDVFETNLKKCDFEKQFQACSGGNNGNNNGSGGGIIKSSQTIAILSLLTFLISIFRPFFGAI